MRKTKQVLIAIAIVSSALAGVYLFGAKSSFLDEANQPSPLKTKDDSTVIHEMQKAYQRIYEDYKDSVVFISTEKTVKMQQNNPFADDPFFKQFFGNQQGPSTRKAHGLGTGFILSSDGYICTNYHVIADMDSVTVKVNDKEYKAKVIGSDKIIDIALIKIEGSGKFKPVHLGNSDELRVGDIVVAIGNPFGLDRTFTSGIVSATGRTAIDATGNSHIQTDASINQGNSGGPLINIDGEVIGVNRAILSENGGNVGIGFSIPINVVKTTLLQLKEFGKVKRGYIGVQISPLTEDFSKELGLANTEGALVGGIEENSPAEKGGARVRDVIIAVDDKPIKEYRELVDTVSKTEIGKTVKITLWRDKKKTNIWVTVKERP
ncbi:MAG: trypsin-like peptidase domain-containing protein [Spirochaetia bacterium]|jgi:Do/DeqQ family serine protease|nr:trypsin-like peptidase domain-containing protein [Spirochaetia bacterium]